jgi:hypothetical protein
MGSIQDLQDDTSGIGATRSLLGGYTPGGATPAPSSSRVARTPMRQTSILDEARQVAAMQV